MSSPNLKRRMAAVIKRNREYNLSILEETELEASEEKEVVTNFLNL